MLNFKKGLHISNIMLTFASGDATETVARRLEKY
jgi:hypothetical protein